jgi:glycosidase
VSSSIPKTIRARLFDHLSALYGSADAPEILKQLTGQMEAFTRNLVLPENAAGRPALSERTAVLITYGDQVHEPHASLLHTLVDVLEETASGLISDVHVLPFFPYSSDDGFAVIDYESVNPVLGDWGDVHRLAEHFGLMVDLVLNHVSAKSRWFEAFLRGEDDFEDYFITVDEGVDLSTVVRPRALPLLTPVETASGWKNVWTTFSADQIDLNYANPRVLLRMIDVLLFYVGQGATLIRLDAVAFLWKRIGEPSIHCEETHRIVKLMRAVLDAVAPDVLLITETNVPHEENISYFGDGSDEAQLVYQFPLPPLVVDAFHQADASKLSEWAGGLAPPPGDATFFNFLASHDGVGLRPLEGLLESSRVGAMVERTLDHGGQVSYKHDPDGKESAYELNISFFDALSNPESSESIDLQVERFLSAQAIMLSLAGVPGIYFHSLFGSRSWAEGVVERGEKRAINREKVRRDALLAELHDPNSLRAKAFDGYRRLLRARGSSSAFHPKSPQRVLELDRRVFAVLRGSPRNAPVLCLHNVSDEGVPICIDAREAGWSATAAPVDMLAGEHGFRGASRAWEVVLRPHETLWLAEATE